jgi:ABC-type arginine/histidine transport system permease subunit
MKRIALNPKQIYIYIMKITPIKSQLFVIKYIEFSPKNARRVKLKLVV